MNAQNSEMLYQFLIESLTTTFMGHVLLYKNSYMLNNSYNKPPLLKQILALTHIDTRAKVFYIYNDWVCWASYMQVE